MAALTARYVIDYLQDNCSEINHWIWISEVIPESQLDRPFSVKEQSFMPHSQCQFCNADNLPSVSIDEKTLEFMKSSVVEKTGTETGGVLAVYYNDNGSIRITHASRPGPNAKESPTGFEKDIEYCQNFLDAIFKENNGRVIYIGEWHSHPTENNLPSNTDLRSLSAISYQKEYLTDKPMMIIFTKSGLPSCTIHPVGKLFKKVELLINDE